MRLTSDQQHQLQQGAAVSITVNQTECVILRKNVYEQRDIDPRPTYAAVLNAWDADDENPAQYQEYLRDA